jgi:hypothetical protein
VTLIDGADKGNQPISRRVDTISKHDEQSHQHDEKRHESHKHHDSYDNDETSSRVDGPDSGKPYRRAGRGYGGGASWES